MNLKMVGKKLTDWTNEGTVVKSHKQFENED